MASGYNRVIMVGNLTRDPELKQLNNGQSVCRLNLASNRQYKNRNSGDMVQEVCYIDVDVWGPQADSASQYLEKGRQVLIEGRLKLDSWQDTDGNNRSKHSIVADRVVFLASGQGQSESAGIEQKDTFEPRNQVERELMSQLNDIKQRTAPQAQQAQPGYAQRQSQQFEPNQAAFKDEPPFQDDLPF